jgi:IclR family acetate operon transcriptional repressor
MTRSPGIDPPYPAADDASGTVARVIRLLRHVAETGGSLSVKSIAASLSLPSSTVHRQLQLLARAGLVEHDEASHTYRAGREFFRIASLVVQQFDVGPMVRPVLDALRDETGETCFFTLYLPAAREATIVEIARSPHPLRYQVERFTHIRLAWGSLGRSILAHLAEADVEAILAAAGPAPATGRAPPAAATLRAELERIRQRGYAMSKGQNIAGGVGLASAVFDGRGAVVGSIGLTMPQARFTSAVSARCPGRVVEHARRVSMALGWRDDATGVRRTRVRPVT